MSLIVLAGRPGGQLDPGAATLSGALEDSLDECCPDSPAPLAGAHNERRQPALWARAVEQNENLKGGEPEQPALGFSHEHSGVGIGQESLQTRGHVIWSRGVPELLEQDEHAVGVLSHRGTDLNRLGDAHDAE